MKKILAFVITGVVFGTGSLFADSSEVGKYEQGKISIIISASYVME